MSNFQVQFSRGPALSWPSPARMVCPEPAWRRAILCRPQLEVHAHCGVWPGWGKVLWAPRGAPWTPSEKEDDLMSSSVLLVSSRDLP